MEKRSPEDQEMPYDPAMALRYRNITGLISGRTTLAGELSLLYTQAQIVGSCIRDLPRAIWDGTRFA